MGHHVNSIPILSHPAADSAAVSSAKQEVKEQLKSLEGRAFGACEYQKAIAYMHTESVQYERGQR